MSVRIPISREAIEAFCRKWKVREFALFGSVLRPDFRSDSDVDVLIAPASDAEWTLFTLAAMRDELIALFGRDVDLVTKAAVERSRNPGRRREILSSAQVLHAA